LHKVKYSDTIAKTNKGQARCSASNRSVKVFDGTPKVRQVYYLSLIPSNSLYPLGALHPRKRRKQDPFLMIVVNQARSRIYQAISLKTAVRNKTDLVDTSGVSRSIGIARHLINIVLVRVTSISKEWHYGKCKIFRAVCPLCLNDWYSLN
jgi:hypothetical protein